MCGLVQLKITFLVYAGRMCVRSICLCKETSLKNQVSARKASSFCQTNKQTKKELNSVFISWKRCAVAHLIICY